MFTSPIHRIVRRRAGMSMIEMMVICFIIGVVAAIGFPTLVGARERANLESAKDQIRAALSTARAAAIRQGYPAQFHAQSGSVWVTAASGSATGPQLQIGIPAGIERTLGVVVTPSTNAALIQYDGRGFATLASSAKIRLSAGALTDSICITRLGSVMKGGCL